MSEKSKTITKTKTKTYNVFLDSTEIRCKPNGVLTSRILNYILSNGHNLVETIAEADYIILNTCGADDFREKTSIDRINIYKMQSKERLKKIIFLGCLTKINVEALNSFLPDIKVIQNNSELDEIFYINVKYEDLKIEFIDDRVYEKLKIPLHDGAFGKLFKKIEELYRKKWQQKRIDVEICEGCPFNCSYCAMGRSRGKIVISREAVNILEDIKKLISTEKVISLVADDCGSYGIDRGTNLCDLIQKIHNKFPKNQVDIYYVNPYWIEKQEDRYIELHKRTNISAITIPVQSGSNRIINSMNRKYDINKIKSIVKKIKKASPNTVVITHLMVGFPGEKLSDFLKTIKLVGCFDICNPIVYSDRPGTPSSVMPDKNSNFLKFIKHKVLTVFCVSAFILKSLYRKITL